MDKKLENAKNIVTWIAGSTAGFTVNQILKTLAPTTDLKLLSKIRVMIGAAVLGGLVAKKAADYASAEFDDLVEKIEKKFKKKD